MELSGPFDLECPQMFSHSGHSWSDDYTKYECPGVLASRRGPNLVVADGDQVPCHECESTDPICDHRTILTGDSFMEFMEWLAEPAEEAPGLRKSIIEHRRENW